MSETPSESPGVVPAYLAGRCANGFERGRGRLVHAIPDPGKSYPVWGAALCGAQPGRTSAGWNTEAGREITCKRCQKRMEKR